MSPNEPALETGRRSYCDAAARTIEELDLAAQRRYQPGGTVSLRRMILTVLLDTTRHARHADVVREMLDGRVGSHPGDAMVPDDEGQPRMYPGRVTGEADRDTWTE